MRRHIFALSTLALVAGCATSTPKPVPPKVTPVVAAAEAPKPPPVPDTRTISHKDWEITVPYSWKVSDEDEEGVNVVRVADGDTQRAEVQVTSSEIDPTISADEAAEIVSEVCSQLATSLGDVEDVKRAKLKYDDRVASVTMVEMGHRFIGCLGVLDESTHRAYSVLSNAAKTDGRVMSMITKTFHLHNPVAAPKQ